MTGEIEAVVFDVGRVIVQWELRHLFARLIEDPAELDWFCTNVVTEEWHFEHDAGRPLDEMVPERQALFPDHAHLIEAYRHRFLDTIPGPVPGTAELIERLADHGVLPKVNAPELPPTRQIRSAPLAPEQIRVKHLGRQTRETGSHAVPVLAFTSGQG